MEQFNRDEICNALDSIYPVLHTLVGDQFFTLLAGQYGAQDDAGIADIGSPRFGDRFGLLLLKQYADHPELDKLAVLAELARLEWLCHDASSKPDPEQTANHCADALSYCALDTQCIHASPGLRMMYSHWPLINIWHAYCANRMDKISPAGGQQWLCIFHDHDSTQSETQVEVLEESEATLLGAVLKGYTPNEINTLSPASIHCLPTLIERHWLDCSCVAQK